MSIDSNIIFTIGSKLGPGGFASLKAGLDIIAGLVKKFDELTKELDRSAQAWQRTNKQAVLMADSAAGGLIDTNTIIKQYNVLMEAGVKITDQQFKIMTARAVELAKATGQEATPAFIRLTNAVRSGSTEAFREYGINLKQSTKLTDTHKNAIKGLTEGYENLESKAETTNERLYALKNNIGTLATILWSESGSSGTLAFALDEVNSALSTFNEEMARAPKAMKEFMKSGEMWEGFILEMKIRILELSKIPQDMFRPGLEILSGMGLDFATEALKTFDIMSANIDRKQKELSDKSRRILENYRRAANIEEPSPGGGPRRIREVGGVGAGPDFGQEDLEKDLAERRVLEDFLTEQRNRKLEADKAAKELEREMERQRMEESRAWQAEYYEFLAEEESKKIDRQRLGFYADQNTLKATETMWKKSLQSRATMMGGFFGIIGQLQESENEKAWRIGKAANIAKTAIDTYTGAIAAYKAMAGIPYVGPFLGAAAAAAVTVMGLQAIRNIKATNFTDEGQPGFVPESAKPKITSSSGGSYSSYAGMPTGAVQNTTRTERQEMVVEIVMKDDGLGLFDVVMNQNDRASRDGRRSFPVGSRAA